MASDVLVSARVTQSKKDATKKVLASLEATTSDLINSAFDYVLEKKELPTARQDYRPTSTALAQFINDSSLPIDWGADASDGDYRKLLRGRKQEAYESLA